MGATCDSDRHTETSEVEQPDEEEADQGPALKKNLSDLQEEIANLKAEVESLNELVQNQKFCQFCSSDGPDPPAGMTRINQVTEAMREQQKKDPKKWSCTVINWFKVLEHTITLRQYIATMKQKYSVNMYVSTAPSTSAL